MDELIAMTPCDGLLPVTIGDVTLTEDLPAAMTSIAPYTGQDDALNAALKDAYGLDFPAINRSTVKADARAIWFGQGIALLQGPVAVAELAEFAALADQSDGWAVVRLEGKGASDVLARLVPVDLRRQNFEQGHTVRTELAHMMASITRIGPDALQVMVFRSMARTLVHDLKTAMAGVAARG